MRPRLLLAAAVPMLLLGPIGAHGQDQGAPPDERKVVYLTIRHAIALALRNNHDISLAEIDPRLAHTDEIRALASFDPTIFGDFEYEESRREASTSVLEGLFLSGATSAGQKRFEWHAGVKRKWVTGTDLTLQFTAREVRPIGGGGGAGGLGALFGGGGSGNDEQVDTEALAVVTQPILRNFGFDANLAEVRTARNNRIISVHDLENQIRRTIDDTLQTYWDLVFAVENRSLRIESLRRAERYLSIAQAQQNAGQGNPLAILQAQVEIARVQGDILQSEQDLGDVEDRLKRLIMPDNLAFEQGALLVPTEKPTLEQTDTDLEESIRIAIENRPDVLAAKSRIENSRISISRAENQLLPIVNFKGAGGYSGVDDDLGNSWEDIHDLDNPLWRVGVEVEFPLGNRAAQAAFDRARLELSRNQIALDRVTKIVIVEVREAIREIRTAEKQIATTHQARQLSERQLEAETLRFQQLQETSNKTLLDFESDLTNAQIAELQAFVKYKKARIRLETATAADIREYLRLAPLPAGYRHLEE